MATTDAALTKRDLDTAARLVAELQRNGREADALALQKLIVQVQHTQQAAAALEDVLTPEDLADVDRGLEDIAAGRVIPHEIVLQGAEAVAAHRRHRDTRSPAPDA
jgi:predicted transcriptional regulator